MWKPPTPHRQKLPAVASAATDAETADTSLRQGGAMASVRLDGSLFKLPGRYRCVGQGRGSGVSYFVIFFMTILFGLGATLPRICEIIFNFWS